MTHPARAMPFDELWNGLQAAKAEKLVNESLSHDGLSLFCYTDSCTYEKGWNPITMLARGLILDPARKTVVASPFPKFFNVGERMDSIPDLPFETFEKLDGSLIILFQRDGVWRCATKGSFHSQQAKWAAEWIKQYDLSPLNPEVTYLAEAIYPENRIVVHYGHSGLVLLAAYHSSGTELPYDSLLELGEHLTWPIAKRHSFNAVSELLALAKTLPASEEGFVLRFSDGLRLKVKGDEYCRIHRMVSRLSPLAMWEAMQAGDDLNEIRKQLPEEFWADFDTIITLIQKRVDGLIEAVREVAEPLAELSDKEVGLQLNTFSNEVRRFIFPWRNNKGDLLTGRIREPLFRAIRPDANILPGYAPSSAMNRVMEEI